MALGQALPQVQQGSHARFLGAVESSQRFPYCLTTFLQCPVCRIQTAGSTTKRPRHINHLLTIRRTGLINAAIPVTHAPCMHERDFGQLALFYRSRCFSSLHRSVRSWRGCFRVSGIFCSGRSVGWSARSTKSAASTRSARCRGRRYAAAMLVFNIVGALALLVMEMTQAWLPLNPQHLPNVPFALAFNTAVSFMTNTNWQAYSGEATMSYFTQMAGLAVHNFISAATGIAVAVALIRGLVRKQAKTLGNFWADLTRCTLYLLLPLSILFTVVLAQQGVAANSSQLCRPRRRSKARRNRSRSDRPHRRSRSNNSARMAADFSGRTARIRSRTRRR